MSFEVPTVITTKIAVFGYVTGCCLVDFKRYFVGTFCLHFQGLLWLCGHAALNSITVWTIWSCQSRDVSFWQGARNHGKYFCFFYVCLCVFFPCGGIVDDQLHDGKEYFFLIIFMRTKKLLSRPLCFVFRDHITFSWIYSSSSYSREQEGSK